MNLLTLSLAYLRARSLSAALNVLLLGLGVGTIVVLLLFRTSWSAGWSATRGVSIWWWERRAARCN